jgi:SAM-dependent MidA family methyltransferase
MIESPMVLHLKSTLEAAGGWMPFDIFMSEVLYTPGLGYYSSGRVPFGLMPDSGSDFVTAPELSPLFGRCLARQVEQALLATGTHTIYEFGAGSGAMAAQLLSALPKYLANGRALEYKILDLSGGLRAEQMQRLARFEERVEWLSELPIEFEGVVLGNEVLDAMPVKLLHFNGHQWLERGVGLASAQEVSRLFHWVDRATNLRPPFDHEHWVPGTVTEVHPYAKAWVLSVAERLRSGVLLLIDYGFTDAEYYHPQRIGGTLMCHHRHRSDTDPLVDVGHKDITSHVNFTGIALVGQDAGLEVLGYTSQAHFLLNCGLAKELAEASHAERSKAQLLFHEHEMGELFKVIAFVDSKHVFDAIGFQNGDRSHRL